MAASQLPSPSPPQAGPWQGFLKRFYISLMLAPVVVIFALVVGEHSYGLTGALLAVPVASMVQVLFLFFRRKMWTRTDASGERLDTQGERPSTSG